MSVVVRLPTWHDAGQLGRNFADFQAGDKAGQVMGVCPQVPNDAGFPGNAGRGAPDRLLVSFSLQQRRSPTGSMLDLHDPDLAQFSITNHITGLTYHRIASIVVSNAED